MMSEERLDLVYVVSPRNRGWILEAICDEIDRFYPGHSAVHATNDPLPQARAYFFSHWSLFLDARRAGGVSPASTSLVLFTHPPEVGRLRRRRIARGLRGATQVISMCSTHVPTLVRAGVAQQQVVVVLPGADPERFRPHRRGDGVIGLSTAYYPRKSPGRVIDLVQGLPHRQVLLVGRGWEDTPELRKAKQFANFEYREAPYDEYPGLYDRMDVFVSPSRLEGGPISLLEAMMANAVPVATRTGFAPDLIQDGVNGYLCPTSVEGDELCQAVERAFALEADVRATVEHLTWERYSRAIQALL